MRQDHAEKWDLPVAFTRAASAQLVAWIANVLLIGGVIFVSVHPPAAIKAPVFFAFLAGHLCLTAHARRNSDLPMLVLNAFLSLLDLYAIGVRL